MTACVHFELRGISLDSALDFCGFRLASSPCLIFFLKTRERFVPDGVEWKISSRSIKGDRDQRRRTGGIGRKEGRREGEQQKDCPNRTLKTAPR